MQDTHLLTVKKHLPKVNVKNTRVPAAQSGELNLCRHYFNLPRFLSHLF